MSSTGQHMDVIFVVEGTALCGAYLHELRSQYIIPTIEHFSGPIDEKDCGSDSNYCLYGLVVFHAADALPGFQVNSVGPLNTSYKLLNQIDRIRFTGGHGEAMSNLAEGLATALECLDDLSQFRSTLTDVTAKRHIILVCNCKPYGVPVSGAEGTDDDYMGKTVEQLAAAMIEKEIHLSIMSPRKIPSLIQLFDQSGGDISSQKGYSRDSRHLILLNGYNLKVNEERPPSPVRVNQEQFPLSNTPQLQQMNQTQMNSNAPPTSIHLSVTAQQLPSGNMSNPQSQPIVSAPSPMMQLPRSPASSVPTSTTPLGQIQQPSPGMPTQNNPSLQQQPNMSQLSQQQVMQMQQQQMFSQQQFRNPRPMASQGPLGNVRPMNPQQQQMNPHLQQMSQQGAQVPGGPQQQHLNKLQQQVFQQNSMQQQQQAQMQNIAMQQQQQNIMQQQNQPQQNSLQQMAMQQPNPLQQQQQNQLLQQQQNQMQQNLLQQQQNALQQQQMQQGQSQMIQGQQNQIPILQQGQNPMQGQASQVPMHQQSQSPMGQNPIQQQTQNPMQQGQMTMQPQQGGISAQQMAQQQAQQPMMQQRWPNQMTPQQQQIQMAQQQARIQMPNQIPPHPQPTSSPLQRPPQEILARLNQPPMVGSPTANTNPITIQQPLGAPALQRERRIIWNGYLEWHEKQKGTPEGLKIPRQVPCHVSSTVVNNEPEVKGDGWPSKLIMQLIPKQIVGNLGGTYFLDVKTVLFILQNCDALVSLTKVMDSGFAGCVHFTGSGMPTNSCTIKVLILLYSKERHAYLGFIPNDQAGFVDRIRKVIQQQKTQQAAIRQSGPGLPPSIAQAFTGPGMQGGMVMQGSPQQQQQQQQPQPGLPVSVQQMGSQNQMMMNQNQPTVSQLQQQLGAATQVPPSAPDNIELERQQNVLKIQQLQQALEQAQQRELIYTQQLQSQGPSGPSPGPGGQNMNIQMGNQQMIPGQMGNQQMPIQGQMQQGMRQGMPQQRMQQGAPGQLNTRLKHLLQTGSNVGPPGFRMRMQGQGQQNQMPQQQQQQGPPGQFNEDLGILDLLK